MLLIQWIVILGFAWLLRRPARVIGLPIVIGEMLAGFLLGPTFFGNLLPNAFNTFFQSENIHQISQLATLIVTAYCFVIGLEFDVHHLQGRRSALALTSLASAALPAVIGYLVASYIATYLNIIPTVGFKVSTAICFSLTAFPVLIRIVEDMGMTDQPVGIISIGISAILELLVWASLPIILAVSAADGPAQAYGFIARVGFFLITWVTLIRKGLQWLWTKIPADTHASLFLLAIVGIVSAYITDRIGIHANFGAFLGGVIVPREVSFKLAKKIKPYCVLLLPIFFAATGLKTTINFGGGSEITILLILAVLAYGVKAFGTTLAVRLTGGLNWNEAVTVGHLMCAKGAIGFAIIEICLSAGFLDSRSYSVLAFIILANTIMAAWGVLIQRKGPVSHGTSSIPILAADHS